MSSNYSERNVISMDIYRIMKQLNLDEKAFTLLAKPSSCESPHPSSDEEDPK